MEILNSSIDEIGESFLHPGYMSAYVEVTAPGQMTAAIVPLEKEPVVQMDMAVALRLTEGLREPDVIWGPMQQGPSPPSFPWIPVLVVALLAALSRKSSAGMAGKRFRRMAWATAATGLLVVAAACDRGQGDDVVPDPGPRLARGHAEHPGDGPSNAVEQVESVPFSDPRKATLAILHGIVADALACSQAKEIESLDTVSIQVGLPFTHPTPGMRYAVANYEDDGWGHRFRLQKKKKNRYKVTSAGEDGAFDTSDDISLEVKKADQQDWPSQLHGFFLRRERSDVALMYHHCGPRRRTVRRANHSTARGLIGDKLYGALPEHKVSAAKRKAMHARLDRVIQDRSDNPRPKDALALVVYDPKDMGRTPRRRVHVYRP